MKVKSEFTAIYSNETKLISLIILFNISDATEKAGEMKNASGSWIHEKYEGKYQLK